mmetsp:Transcript_14753/g.63841  ORF Transcript_14753/g.63841 Transcript_14753/m.63841 type:complete len:584 (+) Transcript_14753:314-2065(+)
MVFELEQGAPRRLRKERRRGERSIGRGARRGDRRQPTRVFPPRASDGRPLTPGLHGGEGEGPRDGRVGLHLGLNRRDGADGRHHDFDPLAGAPRAPRPRLLILPILILILILVVVVVVVARLPLVPSNPRVPLELLVQLRRRFLEIAKVVVGTRGFLGRAAPVPRDPGVPVALVAAPVVRQGLGVDPRGQPPPLPAPPLLALHPLKVRELVRQAHVAAEKVPHRWRGARSHRHRHGRELTREHGAVDALRPLQRARLAREVNPSAVLWFAQCPHVVLVGPHAHVRVRAARPRVLRPPRHAPVQQLRRRLIHHLHHLAKDLDDVVLDLRVGAAGEALAKRGRHVRDDDVGLAVRVHVDESVPLVGAVQESGFGGPEAPLEPEDDLVLGAHAQGGNRGSFPRRQRGDEHHLAASGSTLQHAEGQRDDDVVAQKLLPARARHDAPVFTVGVRLAGAVANDDGRGGGGEANALLGDILGGGGHDQVVIPADDETVAEIQVLVIRLHLLDVFTAFSVRRLLGRLRERGGVRRGGGGLGLRLGVFLGRRLRFGLGAIFPPASLEPLEEPLHRDLRPEFELGLAGHVFAL